jgi:hypothetical protein
VEARIGALQLPPGWLLQLPLLLQLSLVLLLLGLLVARLLRLLGLLQLQLALGQPALGRVGAL